MTTTGSALRAQWRESGIRQDRRCYAKARAGEKQRCRLYDAPHEFICPSSHSITVSDEPAKSEARQLEFQIRGDATNVRLDLRSRHFGRILIDQLHCHPVQLQQVIAQSLWITDPPSHLVNELNRLEQSRGAKGLLQILQPVAVDFAENGCNVITSLQDKKLIANGQSIENTGFEVHQPLRPKLLIANDLSFFVL